MIQGFSFFIDSLNCLSIESLNCFFIDSLNCFFIDYLDLLFIDFIIFLYFLILSILNNYWFFQFWLIIAQFPIIESYAVACISHNHKLLFNPLIEFDLLIGLIGKVNLISLQAQSDWDVRLLRTQSKRNSQVGIFHQVRYQNCIYVINVPIIQVSQTEWQRGLRGSKKRVKSDKSCPQHDGLGSPNHIKESIKIKLRGLEFSDYVTRCDIQCGDPAICLQCKSVPNLNRTNRQSMLWHLIAHTVLLTVAVDSFKHIILLDCSSFIKAHNPSILLIC